MLFATGYTIAGTWTTLDYPGAGSTMANGISGNNIVGMYGDGHGVHGFLYNGTNWTTLNAPGANYTSIEAIDGSNLVGTCNYPSGDGLIWHGVIYDGISWTTLDAPGATNTEIRGIDGSNLVGWCRYGTSEPGHGFLYDGTNWNILDVPGSDYTIALGISGNNIVGQYSGGGFLYNSLNDSWTTLPINPTAIDGSNIVGGNQLYNLTTGSLTTLNVPGSITGISGNSVVGYINDSSGEHGFLYTIPEPATLLLLGLGAVIAVRRR